MKKKVMLKKPKAASKAKPETTLVLRVCKSNGTSYNGFQWPLKVGATITAPDFNSNKQCGNGLHGWLYGMGDHSCVDYWHNADAKWLVLEVEKSTIINLGGKVKFPSAKIKFIGGMSDAAVYIIKNEPKALADRVIGGTATAGDHGTATAGDHGTATAGLKGTATAGDYGTATAGDHGTATAGNEGTAIAGWKGTAIAGLKGTATAGWKGTATAGNEGTAIAGWKGTAIAGWKGTAIAGWKGTATAGDYGTATAGDYGTATAGDHGTATAGNEGEIRIRHWDGKRYRTKVGCIGEGGLKSNIKYRLNDQFNFVEVK